MGYGGYAGDPRGRESAIEDRQRGGDDVQSQVDSFSSYDLVGNDREGYNWVRVAPKGPSMDQMRSRTFSAPAPTPKTPVQKAYNEIRTKTPTGTTRRTTRTPRNVVRDVDHDQDSGGSVASPSVPKQSESTLTDTGKIALTSLAGLTAAQAAAMAKHALTGQGKSWLPNRLYSKVHSGAPASTSGWWQGGRTPLGLKGTFFGARPTLPGTLGLAATIGAGSYLGTTGLLKATGGQDFYSTLGSKIAEMTGATTTPQSSWSDLLAWANKQTSQMEGN